VTHFNSLGYFGELVRDLIAVIWRLCYLSRVFVFFVI
jgi:hypothetical protein